MYMVCSCSVSRVQLAHSGPSLNMQWHLVVGLLIRRALNILSACRTVTLNSLLQALVYNAGLYGRAQALRRDGQAPRTLGIADDLPDR